MFLFMEFCSYRKEIQAYNVESTEDMKKHICKRCGLCCQTVGSLFFLKSYHPLIRVITVKMSSIKNEPNTPCCMLSEDEEGLVVCLLEKYLGYDAKGFICKMYPKIGEQCANEKRTGKRQLVKV